MESRDGCDESRPAEVTVRMDSWGYTPGGPAAITYGCSHSVRVITLIGGNCFPLKAVFRSGNCFASHASKSLTTSASSRVIASVRSIWVWAGLPS